jgi:Transposase DDE domain
LLVFLIALVGSGKKQGVEGQSGDFFRLARRSDLWPNAEAVHRSTVTLARAKVSWTSFEQLHHASVNLAYELWPTRPSDTWEGLSVFAVDGSKYTLPATEALRQAFDPESGLAHPGKGHFPQCLVSTAYDVFRRLPIARTVQPIAQANEREELKALLPYIPRGGVILCDRGYPSYDLLTHLESTYQGYWLIRCPARGTFSAVEGFVRSGQTDAIITLTPPKGKSLRVRAVRLLSPDGTISVLLTNLMDKVRFSAASLITLYFRRWAVETHYRDEKTSLDIQVFHARSENGIRQELFAIVILAVITRILMVQSVAEETAADSEPQFKHAMITLATEAAVLTPHCPAHALEIFNEVLTEIARVRYYKPKLPRPSQPRVCRKAMNKWQLGKTKQTMTS